MKKERSEFREKLMDTDQWQEMEAAEPKKRALAGGDEKSGNKDQLSVQAVVSPAQNEMYADFVVKYMGDFQKDLGDVPGLIFQKINAIYGVVYAPLTEIDALNISTYSYSFIPKCYTHMDFGSLSASGITRLQEHPYLQLKGQGTAIAIVDSGIDYRNSLFQNEMGSRILCIWDQTLEGDGTEVPYGRVFWKNDIDRALASENPLEIVPSTDTNGHGTRMAAVAAGNYFPEENFSGAAPEAMLIVVKVKQAKKYLREFYLFPSEAELFQENDIMMGVDFAVRTANDRKLPLSVCLGIGSSQGAHIGRNPLSIYVDYASQFSRISVSIAAGNEGAARHHYAGRLTHRENQASAELRVGNKEPGFTLEFWGEPPEIYNLSLQSPTGEILDISASLGDVTQELSFIFVETRVEVNYVSIERQTGYTLAYFRFIQPAAGIWRIFVQGRDGQNVEFHMWLPVQGLISEETYFLEPSPYNTVTAPGDSLESITVTAYQYRDNSLYVQASRGFMPDGNVVPQVAAPGVQIRVPQLNGLYGLASGTSFSAAQTAGAAALLFEWAVVRGNQPYFTGSSVKNYITRGAKREDRLTYPNRDWGFGRMDLYHTFELLT
ncbi:S8 family peptidase [Blautia glucerasea]|uniref:S8 family peptidase n=1 Tax=Blautia glucerasea TaxID=536633 RepID=UPI001D018089|nr:S8 family peptidase [Blautia glucerasea]MCB5386463.1 S8 family peptidase [Blautia glucerasea]MCB5420818.1 S8 family peptidase [Blautia luti]